jgi:hypothetical protein
MELGKNKFRLPGVQALIDLVHHIANDFVFDVVQHANAQQNPANRTTVSRLCRNEG